MAADNIIQFIRECLADRRVFWTYHMNMRMDTRLITRRMIIEATSLEIIESYPDDKYFPSYLVLAWHGNDAFHVLFATDIVNNNVRVITVYRPNPEIWDNTMKTRRNR